MMIREEIKEKEYEEEWNNQITKKTKKKLPEKWKGSDTKKREIWEDGWVHSEVIIYGNGKYESTQMKSEKVNINDNDEI
jgi:hypothetical protein